MKQKEKLYYMANKQIERCFLCGRVKDEVNQLVKGRFGFQIPVFEGDVALFV